MGRRSLESMRRHVVFALLIVVACGAFLLFPERWSELDDRITSVRYAYRARAPRALGGNDALVVARHNRGEVAPGRDTVFLAPDDSFLYSLALCTRPGVRLSPPFDVDLRLRGRRASPVRLYLGSGEVESRYLQLDPGGDLPSSTQQVAGQGGTIAGLSAGAPLPMWSGPEDALYHDFSLAFSGGAIEVSRGDETRSVPAPGVTALDSLCIAPVVSRGLSVLDELTVDASPRGHASSYRAVGSYRLRPLLYPVDLETKLVDRPLGYLLTSLVVLAFIAVVARRLVRSAAGQKRLRIGRGSAVWRTYPPGLLVLPLEILVLCGARAALGLSLLSFHAVVIALIAHGWIDCQWFEPRPLERPGSAGTEPRRTVLAVVTALAFFGFVTHAYSYWSAWSPDLPVALALAPVVALPALLLWRWRMDCRAPFLPTLATLAQFGLYAPAHLVQPAITPITFYALVSIPWIVALVVLGNATPARRRTGDRLFRAVAVVVALVLVEVAMRGDHHLDYVASPQALASSYADPRMLQLAEMKGLVESRPQGASTTVEIAGSTFDVAKPPGQVRIVCLGSSSTFGAGAGTHDGSYPNQLESFLATGTDRDVAVINGGVGGSRLSFLEFYLQHVLLPLDPDLVILYFGMNGDSPDVAQGLARLSTWMETAGPTPTAVEMWAATQLRWPRPGLVRWTCRVSSVRTFGWALGALNGMRYSGRLDVVSGPGSEPYEAAIERAQRGIGSAWGIAEKCRARGTPILLIPEISQSESDAECLNDPRSCRHPYYAVFQQLAGASESDEVYYGDLLPSLPAELRGERMLDEVHMDREGYGLLAWAIAELAEDEPALLLDPSR